MHKNQGTVTTIWGAWPTYVAFCVIGFFSFLLGIVLSLFYPMWTNIAAGFGIAFVVGGITGLVHIFYVQKEIRQATHHQVMESLGMHMHESGLRRIFPERPVAEMKAAIQNAKKEIRITGSSLKGLVGVEESTSDQEAAMGALVGKVKQGIPVKILLTHPIIAGHREKMESREKGWIPTEVVKNLVHLVVSLQRASTTQPPLWSIRLYVCGPTVFSLEVDSTVLFLQPYPLAGTAMDNFCIVCDIPATLHNNLKRFMKLHFDAAWDVFFPDRKTQIESLADITSIVNELTTNGDITKEQGQELSELIEKHQETISKG